MGYFPCLAKLHPQNKVKNTNKDSGFEKNNSNVCNQLNEWKEKASELVDIKLVSFPTLNLYYFKKYLLKTLKYIYIVTKMTLNLVKDNNI